MPAGSFSNIAALDKHNFLAQSFQERRFVIAVFFLSAVANRRSLMTWGEWDALIPRCVGQVNGVSSVFLLKRAHLFLGPADLGFSTAAHGEKLFLTLKIEHGGV